MRVNGEIEGVKHSILTVLDELYNIKLPQDQLWTQELLNTVSFATYQINKEIALFADRKGRITDVAIGDSNTVTLSQIEDKKRGKRLSGVRCIHTHPESSGMLSAVDLSSLKTLRLDFMIAVGVKEGMPNDIFVGVASPANTDECDVFGPYKANKEDFSALYEYLSDADRALKDKTEDLKTEAERAILVGMVDKNERQLRGAVESSVSFSELEELAYTAGAAVVGKLMQKKDVRNASTLIGQGKVEELRLAVQALEADVVIVDEELSGAQQRNLEAIVGVKVIDRTGLILDIFAQRARSREGILQVELAQLEYRLPRLTGKGVSMSRQGASLGGGLGTRGPGETKLETDKQHIRARILAIKGQLEDVKRQRAVLRSDRRKSGVPVVSFVGYTNAGKSTLLNTMTNAGVLAEDKLFATLDTTTRKIALPGGGTALLTDTVGFIRKLPHHLLDAFKSTLEEVVLSDLVVVVSDASDPQVEDHIRIVDETLAGIGAGERPVIIALNKMDKVDSAEFEESMMLRAEDRPVVKISALNGDGLPELIECIETHVRRSSRKGWFLIPYSEAAMLAWLHENGTVFTTGYVEAGTLVQAEIPEAQFSFVAKFEAEPPIL